MHITIFVEPKAKSRPRFGVSKSGKSYAYTDHKTAHAENMIRDKVMECNETFGDGVPIKLDATFYFRRPKHIPKNRLHPVVRPDYDNVGKLLTDSLEKFVYKNDAQIVDCYIKKRYGSPPRIELSIEELL